jgi:signal transduction histidine kinase
MAIAARSAEGPHWSERWSAITPIIADILLTLTALALALGGLMGTARRQQEPLSWWSVALVLISTLPLVARRRQPIVVFAVAEGALLLACLTLPLNNLPPIIGWLIALYTMTSLIERRTSLRIATCVGVLHALILTISALLGQDGGWSSLFFVTAATVGSWSLGDNIRTRRAYLSQLEERARRLELEREEGARRAVQEERMRIARELHDVVAHHVSAIAVQAAAAAEVAARDPQSARDALQFIQETSRQALTEMRALLTVLRSGDEPGADRAPQPSLAQIERLIAQSRAAGLAVTLTIEGDARPLPEALDLSAYRIVQEALTNSFRHAGRAQTSVQVHYGADALSLTISDNGRGPGGASPGSSEGRGLIGMRERVALFGGELTVGAGAAGGFTVRARLPLRQP